MHEKSQRIKPKRLLLNLDFQTLCIWEQIGSVFPETEIILNKEPS